MTAFRFFQWFAAALACVSWVLPVSELVAAPPVSQAVTSAHGSAITILDVSLGENECLAGQLLGVQGRPLAKQFVIVESVAGGTAGRAVTDNEGRFRVEGLNGGLLRVTAGGASVLCRCWVATTAPPAATSQLLLVSDDSVSRGQQPIGELLFSNPILIGLIVAAAIAIPIAVHNSKKSAS